MRCTTHVQQQDGLPSCRLRLSTVPYVLQWPPQTRAAAINDMISALQYQLLLQVAHDCSHDTLPCTTSPGRESSTLLSIAQLSSAPLRALPPAPAAISRSAAAAAAALFEPSAAAAGFVKLSVLEADAMYFVPHWKPTDSNMPPKSQEM